MDLLEIIEDRHARMATIIASQLPVAGWYDVFGEENIADALLDRLLHASHRIGFLVSIIDCNCELKPRIQRIVRQ